MTFGRSIQLVGILASLLLTPGLRAQPSSGLAPLLRGQVEEAVQILRKEVTAHPNESTPHLLLCRAAFAQDHAEAAVTECERAATLSANDSETQMWLGRALGMKAAKANPLSAFSIARRVATAFEKAVALDRSNIAAAGDLGEFYIAAPVIVGGGLDKLTPLTAQLMTIAPAKAHRLLALRAQKMKNKALAENEFRLAVSSGHTPESLNDLALFLQLQKRPDEAAAAAAEAIAQDERHGPPQVDAAGILTAVQRRPELAIAALERYLNSSAQSDAAPVFKAHLELGRLLLKAGDTAAAQAEFRKAADMAPNFAPAASAFQALNRKVS